VGANHHGTTCWQSTVNSSKLHADNAFDVLRGQSLGCDGETHTLVCHQMFEDSGSRLLSALSLDQTLSYQAACQFYLSVMALITWNPCEAIHRSSRLLGVF